MATSSVAEAVTVQESTGGMYSKGTPKTCGPVRMLRLLATLQLELWQLELLAHHGNPCWRPTSSQVKHMSFDQLQKLLYKVGGGKMRLMRQVRNLHKFLRLCKHSRRWNRSTLLLPGKKKRQLGIFRQYGWPFQCKWMMAGMEVDLGILKRAIRKVRKRHVSRLGGPVFWRNARSILPSK